MRRVLFVANGHGENAIATRIALALRAESSEPLQLDLLSLVGEGTRTAVAGAPALVGPRRTLPSGGLVAMFNVRAFARDVRAGFVQFFVSQLAFLRAAGPRYDVVVAVGDAYALALALLCRRRTLFVGTAKSAYVAPYGPVERALLRTAARVFVRDEPTARALRARRVPAEAPGNVIVDLIDDAAEPPAGRWLGLLPGSREPAYGDGVRLARVAAALAELQPQLGALFSLAPTLDPERFRGELARDGWTVSACRPAHDAFEASRGPARLLGWQGPYGALLRASVAVVGQAGTGNEQAAAVGLPVFVLDGPGAGGEWYRMRQRRLLGEALQLIPREPAAAAAAIDATLRDAGQVRHMARAGMARMGAAGGAIAIARAILAVPA